jgi:hypothetical protein
MPRFAFAALLVLAPGTAAVAQQVPADLARERDEYARWLATAPTSPFAAQALLPLGTSITLGPSDADVPLAGLAPTSVTERGGALAVERSGARTPLPRGRVTSLGDAWRILATGSPDRTVVTIFGTPRAARAPSYYPYAADGGLKVTLVPPAAPRTVALRGPDGTQVTAAEAGTVSATWRGQPIRLTVRRLPGATPDETELQVFFRDRTSTRGSYDGGRFVELIPATDGTYLLDFNRARNPFCAYSSVFPCPAPWPGNTLDVAVEAGERYERKPPAAPGT